MLDSNGRRNFMEDIKNEHEEIKATQEIESTTSDTHKEPKKEENVQTETGSSSNEVQNWRILRERLDRLEHERDAALKKLQEREQQSLKTNNNHEDEATFSDDDLIEGKDLRRWEKKNAQRIAQLEEKLIESNLKAQFPDFYDIVTPESLKTLRDLDPELAESIAVNPNIHSKSVAAYRAIKRYGLVAQKEYRHNQERLQKNEKKPLTTSSLSPQLGETPLSKANDFANDHSSEYLDQVWREMLDIRKRS
jgi:hypothetical protein